MKNWKLSVASLTLLSAISTGLATGGIRPENQAGMRVGQNHDSSVKYDTADQAEKEARHDVPSITGAAFMDLNPNNWRQYSLPTESSLRSEAVRLGITEQEVEAILSLGGSVMFLQSLYAGDKLRLNFSDDQTLLALEYDIHNTKRLLVRRKQANSSNGSPFGAVIIDRSIKKKLVRVSGTIKTSLASAGRQAGLSYAQIKNLVRIFDGDLDYRKDIKKGDRFTVLFEQQFRGEDRIEDGPILAAEFDNHGTILTAVRYAAPNDIARYYTIDGVSKHRPFLRNPVDYALVSSGFNLERKHPIFSKTRAHKGVDFAAKPGTPVKATADGFVEFRGRNGGYGKVVVIQHTQNQSTLYAHLSKFKKHLKRGDRVRQGDIIGYVGQSGRATGPHLHYEFRVNGEHVDPLKLEIPIFVVPDDARVDFVMKSQLLLVQLGEFKEKTIAFNKEKNQAPQVN